MEVIIDLLRGVIPPRFATCEVCKHDALMPFARRGVCLGCLHDQAKKEKKR